MSPTPPIRPPAPTFSLATIAPEIPNVTTTSFTTSLGRLAGHSTEPTSTSPSVLVSRPTVNNGSAESTPHLLKAEAGNKNLVQPGLSTGSLAGIIVGILLGFLLLLGVFYVYILRARHLRYKRHHPPGGFKKHKRRRRHRRRRRMSGGTGQGPPPPPAEAPPPEAEEPPVAPAA